MNTPQSPLHSWGPPPSGSIAGTTLDRHILERQRQIPGATGDFTALFQQVDEICDLARALRKPWYG